MEKIRVVHHSNQLGLGGTEKTMQIFCKYLDKSVFDIHALTYKYPVPRRKIVINRLLAFLGSSKAVRKSADYAMLRCRVPKFRELLGCDRVHLHAVSDLRTILNKIRPHIVHVHHAGETEPPLDQTKGIVHNPLIFTTNVFGLQGRSPHQELITKILFVSQWLKGSAQWSEGDPRCDVLYNPVEKPCTAADLRSTLNIPADTVVVGRIGRNADDIHDSISLRAYKEIETKKTIFLAIAPPPRMMQDARDLGITTIQYLEPSTDPVYLSRFYNTIDILAHARSDGETFGCVIAEAMIHGKPVVTHRSDIRNAQAELVDPLCGFVTEQHDVTAYANSLKKLIDNPTLRSTMGEASRKKALTHFEAGVVTQRLAAFYFAGLKKR